MPATRITTGLALCGAPVLGGATPAAQPSDPVRLQPVDGSHGASDTNPRDSV